MMLEEQVFLQAQALAGTLEESREELLRAMCTASAEALAARLKEGLTPEDCESVFVLAAGLYALAGFRETEESQPVQQLRAGDLTIQQDSSGVKTQAEGLRRQARELMAPYMKDSFAFTGV